MSYYVIGIGGTGAKCVESLIHLAAAGLIPKKDDEDDQKLNIILVDADEDNGNLKRTQHILEIYNKLYEYLRGDDESKPDKLGKVNFLKNKLEVGNWTPFADEIDPSLKKLFSYDAMPTLSAGLMDVFYTTQEKEEKLNHGFIGHPSIGAAVMADTVNLLNQKPWEVFCTTIRNDKKAKIFLFGSIFGGTGAAGLPTLARLLSNHLKDEGREEYFRLGCVLMLPYFSCGQAPPDSQKLQVKSEEFLLKSQAALSYYQEKLGEQGEQYYKSVYILGEPNDEVPKVEYNTGSSRQRNPSHYLELYAATAAIDFFKQKIDEEVKTYKVARQNNSELSWDSIPGKQELELALANLARFSYGYLGHFYKKIKEQRQPIQKTGIFGLGSLRFGLEGWYQEYFTRNKSLKKDEENIQDSLDKKLADYCECLLGWLKSIHKLDGFKVALFDTNTYKSEFDEGTYYKVEVPPEPDEQLERFYQLGNNRQAASKYQDLSNKLLGEINCKDTQREGADGVGCFIHALYKVCEVKQVQEKLPTKQGEEKGQKGTLLLLPERRTDREASAIGPLSSAGEWVGDPGAVLGKLAKALKVRGKFKPKENVRSIDSIPDIWARPLLFKTALFNETHPLHEKVVTEWRGLLAMLALKERLRLPLYTELLQTSDSDPSNLVKVANQLLPSLEFAQDTPWNQVHLLFYGIKPQSKADKGNVIGMTSPATLVCTAAELKGLPNDKDDKAPWFQNGIMTDPCQCDDVDKGALRFWLTELRDKLQEKCPQELAGLLGKFIDGEAVTK